MSSGKRDTMRLKISIRKKIIIFIMTLMAVGLLFGLGLGYFWGFDLLSTISYEKNRSLAEVFAGSITDRFDGKLRDIVAYTDSPIWRDIVSGINMKYSGRTREEVLSYLRSMEERWTGESIDELMEKEFLDNILSRRLRRLVANEFSLGEIFVTDKFGGLAAASGRTNDFYRADERWWQEAAKSTRKKIFVGDIEYDALSATLAIPVSIALREPDGELVGVCKVILAVESFMSPVRNFKVGRSGSTVLIDQNGAVLSSLGQEAEAPIIFREETLRAIFQGEGKWCFADSPFHDGKVLVTWANVYAMLPLFQHDEWKLCVLQPVAEVYAPLFKYLRRGAQLAGLLILILIPLGFIFGGILSRPIMYLRDATERISRGDWGRKITVNTGDEVEELADSFNRMVQDLTRTTISRDELALEIKRSEKVEEELWKSQLQLKDQAAKLDESLKAAIKSREILMSMLDDNNQIRETLEKNLEELTRTQNMLVQSEKLASLGRLVSDMAHEVNNPLMIISGRAQLSLMEDVQNNYLVENFGIIIDQCERATSIIQRLLTFSRPSKGDRKYIDINNNLDFVIKLIEHPYSLSNVKILRRFDDSIPEAYIDEKQMHEVFMNLLKNAADAMPDGGAITVVTKREGDMLRVEFRDTGSGMPEEDMKKVFEPFFTTKEKGTGLGLSVCYGIVKAHNGELRYKSTVGKGTTAIIMLPISGGEECGQ
ncbi:MAG: ATP-binding protein [Candidatus Omnitrophota bacterium]